MTYRLDKPLGPEPGCCYVGGPRAVHPGIRCVCNTNKPHDGDKVPHEYRRTVEGVALVVHWYDQEPIVPAYIKSLFTGSDE